MISKDAREEKDLGLSPWDDSKLGTFTSRKYIKNIGKKKGISN